MKRLVFLLFGLMIMTFESSAQAISESDHSFGSVVLMLVGPLLMLALVAFIFVGVPFLWFRKINKRFKERYPQYEKRYLWSILFFPCFYTVMFSIVIIYILIMIIDTGASPLYGCLLIGIGVLGGIIYLQKEINKSLFNWDYNRMRATHNKIGVLVCLLPLFFIFFPMILGSYKYFLPYNESLNNFLLIFYILLGIMVWYCSGKSLKYLSLLLPTNDNHCSNTIKTQEKRKDCNISISDKLIEIKSLFDNGILTEEEFNKLKREIIDKSK